MAKLLIIEDQYEMCKAIKTQISEINKRFNDATYFFSSDGGRFNIIKLNDQIPNWPRTLFADKKCDVIDNIVRFLDKHNGEDILILLDVLLNSQNINAPSYMRYMADKEYSCELYAELMRIKNGKKYNAYNINGNKVYIIIYSRSDASINVVTSALHDIYKTQNDTNRAFFVKECADFKNVSWCNNLLDETDGELNVKRIGPYANCPLALPANYIKFISTLK